MTEWLGGHQSPAKVNPPPRLQRLHRSPRHHPPVTVVPIVPCPRLPAPPPLPAPCPLRGGGSSPCFGAWLGAAPARHRALCAPGLRVRGSFLGSILGLHCGGPCRRPLWGQPIPR